MGKISEERRGGEERGEERRREERRGEERRGHKSKRRGQSAEEKKELKAFGPSV